MKKIQITILFSIFALGWTAHAEPTTLIKGWTVITEMGQTYDQNHPQPIREKIMGKADLFKVIVELTEDNKTRTLSMTWHKLENIGQFKEGEEGPTINDIIGFSEKPTMTFSKPIIADGLPVEQLMNYAAMAKLNKRTWQLYVTPELVEEEPISVNLDANIPSMGFSSTTFMSILQDVELNNDLISIQKHPLSPNWIEEQNLSGDDLQRISSLIMHFTDPRGSGDIFYSSSHPKWVVRINEHLDYYRQEDRDMLLGLFENARISVRSYPNLDRDPDNYDYSIVLNKAQEIIGVIAMIRFSLRANDDCFVALFKKINSESKTYIHLGEDCF